MGKTGWLVGLLAAGNLAAQADPADQRFQAGRFQEARSLYQKRVTAGRSDHRAVFQLGRIALLSNRLAEAERWLRRARAQDPADSAATRLLAEALYRQDRFPEAAALLRGGREDLKARLLDGFGGRTPYRIEGTASAAELPFLQTDPIPVVTVSVNGHRANFIIDTGGSEVYLEPEFAEQVGAAIAGASAGGFAGGQTKDVRRGRIDSLGLGGFTVRNLPVNIVDTKFIGRDVVAKGLDVAGFIGTVLLYHFLPTLDYPRGRLVLRRKTAANLRPFVAGAARGRSTAVPFWLEGDHYLVTWGAAGRGSPALFLIDTGGAGIGFVPGPAYVAEAGIELPAERADGPAIGSVKVRPFTADSVSVGPLVERSIPAIFGAFPPSLETSSGFRLAGIISHEFFKHYAVTVDFTGMRFFLARGTPADPAGRPEPSSNRPDATEREP